MKSESEKRAVTYRKMVGAMAKVRWCVENDRHRRPDGAVDVRILMDRFREYAMADDSVDFAKQLNAISEFVGLSVDELNYFADVGEWISIERESSEIEDDQEYEKYWSNEYSLPSMNNFYRTRWLTTSPEEREEILALNALYYNTEC